MGKGISLSRFSDMVDIERHAITRMAKAGLIGKRKQNGRYTFDEEDVKKLEERYGVVEYTSHGFVDFTSIPYERGLLRERRDWKKAADIHASIKFKYDMIVGVMEIAEAMTKNQIRVKIGDSLRIISTGSLNAGNLAELLKIIKSEHTYKAGDEIHDTQNDVLITECTRRRGTKAYRYRCNVCQYEDFVKEYEIGASGICHVCHNKKTVPGRNTIEKTDPWMVPFFDNEDYLKYRHGANIREYFICPQCKYKKTKQMTIHTLYSTKSVSCPRCSDGISYPNKYMWSVLEQLKNQNKIELFEREWNADWLGKRRFDFMVSGKTGMFFIEMDGGLGHGRNIIASNGLTADETLKIDAEKDKLAEDHGLSVVRVDAVKSEKTYLKHSIKSALGHRLDLGDIKWAQAAKNATKSKIVEVCEYYRDHNEMLPKEVAEYFGISKSTALRYINQGEEWGLCKYNNLPAQRAKKNVIKSYSFAKREVSCYSLEGVFLRNYESIKSAARECGVSETAIIHCCQGVTKKSAGYIWRYTQQTFERKSIRLL